MSGARQPDPGAPVIDASAPAGDLRILTWHVHGTYLYYLVHTPVQFLLPVLPGRPEGYGGRAGDLEWPANVVEVPAEEVADLEIDVVLTQSRRNLEVDAPRLLGSRVADIPAIHLEHDPPRESPTDTFHFAADGQRLVVHVTPFNALMWDDRETPTKVIDHGVVVPPGLAASHELERGIVVVNGLHSRGRRLGRDVFERLRRSLPLDLVGMESERLGGLGALPHKALLELEARYRFYFSPIRYTSLALATLEAMALGLPVVGLATAELVTVVENGRSGHIDTDPARLERHMRRLLADPAEARRMGEGARARVAERFSIERFSADWLATFEQVADRRRRRVPARSAA